MVTHPRWAPDFLQLAGPDNADATFECSSTFEGVSGAICVTPDLLVLRGATSTTTLRARDVHVWWDVPAGPTFSLMVKGSTLHRIVLLRRFQDATVHAMTRAFGPRSAPDRLSA